MIELNDKVDAVLKATETMSEHMSDSAERAQQLTDLLLETRASDNLVIQLACIALDACDTAEDALAHLNQMLRVSDDLYNAIADLEQQIDDLKNKRNKPKSTRKSVKRTFDGFYGRKLTEEDVVEIKNMINDGETNVDIAKLFDVNPSTISAIRRGKAHKSVKV